MDNDRIDMKNTLCFTIILIIVVTAFCLGRHSVVPKTISVDSIIYDTITYTKVEHDTVWCDSIVYRDLPRVIREVDTVRIVDTVTIALPINNYVFFDSSYRIEAEGYDVKLNKVVVYPRTEYRTNIVKDKSRWGLGIQAGYGVSKDGLSPYVGVGISYNIFTW